MSIHTAVADKVPTESKNATATFKSDIPTFAVDKTPATSKNTTVTPQPDIQPVLKEIPPEIKVFADAMKKVPPTDDIHTFYLWHYLSVKHIQQEQEKLRQEKELEIENLKKIAIKDTDEFKKLQKIEEQIKNYRDDYSKLDEQRTELTNKKLELENNEPLKSILFGFGITQEYKNWQKELRDIKKQLEQNDNEKENAKNIIRISEQQLGDTRRKLEDKKYSMTVSSPKTIELDSKLNELAKDLAYLENIRQHLNPHINDLRSKNDLFKKINKKLGGKNKINYLQFIIKFDKTATTNLKNFNTSAPFIRELRHAEQTVKDTSFLASLVTTLADSLSDTNAPAYSSTADIIKGFEMDINWNLMSELKKDEEKGSFRGMI